MTKFQERIIKGESCQERVTNIHCSTQRTTLSCDSERQRKRGFHKEVNETDTTQPIRFNEGFLWDETCIQKQLKQIVINRIQSVRVRGETVATTETVRSKEDRQIAEMVPQNMEDCTPRKLARNPRSSQEEERGEYTATRGDVPISILERMKTDPTTTNHDDVRGKRHNNCGNTIRLTIVHKNTRSLTTDDRAHELINGTGSATLGSALMNESLRTSQRGNGGQKKGTHSREQETTDELLDCFLLGHLFLGNNVNMNSDHTATDCHKNPTLRARENGSD